MRTSILVFAFGLTACSNGAAPADAGPPEAAAPAAPVAVVADAAPAAPPSNAEAANAAEVVKHPADKALANVAVTVKYANGATALTNTSGGKPVATLKAGTKATAVGQYNGFKRVIFADPNDATKKLEGWIQNYVFESGFEGHPVPACALNQMVVSDAASPLQPRCATRCKAATDCHAPTQYCYNALVLSVEGGEPPPATAIINSCGSNASLVTH